jgi:pyruvate/2-oxoacid:ferredoxin oxidoreductase beta subunit
MELDILIKWSPKASRTSYTYVSRLQSKISQGRKICYFILIKKTINQKGITIINAYAPNIPSFMKQTLLDIKAQVDSNAKKIQNKYKYKQIQKKYKTKGYVNTSLSPIHRLSTHKKLKSSNNLPTKKSPVLYRLNC